MLSFTEVPCDDLLLRRRPLLDRVYLLTVFEFVAFFVFFDRFELRFGLMGSDGDESLLSRYTLLSFVVNVIDDRRLDLTDLFFLDSVAVSNWSYYERMRVRVNGSDRGQFGIERARNGQTATALLVQWEYAVEDGH